VYPAKHQLTTNLRNRVLRSTAHVKVSCSDKKARVCFSYGKMMRKKSFKFIDFSTVVVLVFDSNISVTTQ